MNTLTQRRGSTPGARWFFGGQKPKKAWTITGSRINEDGTEYQITATGFGDTAEQAIERFIESQKRLTADAFGRNPVVFERHELHAEPAI